MEPEPLKLPTDGRPLRSVDTGEIPDGPQTMGEALAAYRQVEAERLDLERQLQELNRKYLGALSQIGKLRADKDAEAEAHELWPTAVTLFMEWKIATGANRPSGENRSKWTPARFWVCHPFLVDDGFGTCRLAVWGIAANPNTKRITASYTEVYDGWELCFRDRPTYERYVNRGAAIFARDWPELKGTA